MYTRLIGLLALAVSSTSLAQDISSAQYQTPQGELLVRTSQPAAHDYGPPPPFAQLDATHAGFITAAQADHYPPLANDFIQADRNRDGRISKAEYERWIHQH